MAEVIYVNGECVGNGKFEYITDDKARQLFIKAWWAVTLTKQWDFMANEFLCVTKMETSTEVHLIHKKMKQMLYNKTSVFTFCECLRYMHYLAYHGEEVFKICMAARAGHFFENEGTINDIDMATYNF